MSGWEKRAVMTAEKGGKKQVDAMLIWIQTMKRFRETKSSSINDKSNPGNAIVDGVW